MTILKGILVILGGFAFIFSSGVPMNLISRHKPDYKREGLYWGIGIWIIGFFLSTFLQNLIRQILRGGTSEAQTNQSGGLLTYLIGAIITTLLIQLCLLLFLKSRRKKDEDLTSMGLALGFGIGLIAQVFTGMILIAAGGGVILQGLGLELPASAIQTPMINTITEAGLFGLIVNVISLILFRVALLTVSAVQGYMVAACITRKKIWFWLAALIVTLFTWLILALQVVLGEENPGQVSLGVTSPLGSAFTALYYLGAFLLGYRWLQKQLVSEKSAKRK